MLKKDKKKDNKIEKNIYILLWLDSRRTIIKKLCQHSFFRAIAGIYFAQLPVPVHKKLFVG